MGTITSRQFVESQKENKTEQQNTTPKNSKILAFDPRSPSENVTRTPITISGTPNLNGTPCVQPLKVLPIDPRSPTSEVTRTPILIEEPNGKRKHQVLKPTKLAEMCFKNNGAAAASATKDPRSPTEKVPRTPLDEESHSKKENSVNELIFTTPELKTVPQPERVHLQADPGISPSKNLVDGSVDKDRRPLTDVQNVSQSHPNSRKQSLPSQDVEEEFAKNEKVILSKLEGQDSKTATDFVENI